MSFQVKVDKMIAKPAGEVFNALKAGLLFMNCGADSGTMKIDFRVGGKYQIGFKNNQLTNFGEFTEIVPDRKIAFTWCQSFSADQKPDTNVTIELFPDGAKTRLQILHTGFATKAIADNHEQGWNSGATDFGIQIQDGRLRMVRPYTASAEKLFAICANPASFFGVIGDLSKSTIDFKTDGKYHLFTKNSEIKGQFLEILPGKKISFTWSIIGKGPSETRVHLVMNQKEDGSSTLELVHEGLKTLEDQTAHRTGWEHLTKTIGMALANA